MKDKATGITSTLYDAQDAIVNIHAPAVANLEVSAESAVNNLMLILRLLRIWLYEEVSTGFLSVYFCGVQALSPGESVNVWADVTTNMLNGDCESAREAKRKVEDAQRALQKQRLFSGTVWSPKYFTADKNGGWEWHCAGRSVASAPLVVE